MRAGPLVRRPAVGVPVAALGAGVALWLLGLTPLPAAPVRLTDALGLLRRGAAMLRGAPLQLHVPPLRGWLRARFGRDR